MKILNPIEKEVDSLTEQACRKWLKRYKQAVFLIKGKLYCKSEGIYKCFNNNGEDVENTNLLNAKVKAKTELSEEIAKIIEEYDVNYVGDVLGTPSPRKNLESWKEYFEDRGLLNHAKEMDKLIEERENVIEEILS
jgi:hypothetical protein